MATTSLKEFSNAWWAEICNRIIGAVVFIDESIAECLHWHEGMFNLMYSGAKCVKMLSPFEHCPHQYKKAVFITQSQSGHLRLIREIIQNARLTHCILISSVSLEVLYMEIVKDQAACDMVASGQALQKATEMLTDMLSRWMSRGSEEIGNVMAQVLHIPIFTITLTNVIFTTPPYAQLYPANHNEMLKEPVADLQALHPVERSRIRRLACALNSMLESMNLREEVFFIGNYSALVAGVLENSPIYINRRKKSICPASLIIVDRTLDLCGVASHSSESVFDKMRSVLPVYPGQDTERAVDMSPICHAKSTNHPNDVHMSPGCIYHSDDVQIFNHMINKTQREVMLEVYDRLSKIDIQRSPGRENLTKVTPSSLEKIINATKGNYDLISKHLGPLQQGLALVQMYKAPKRAALDLLMNLERQVLQSLATSRESTSVLTQIAHLIKTREQRGLPLENLIGLLVHVYSLTGTEFPFADSHQSDIREALTSAVVEEWETLLPSQTEAMTLERASQIAGDIMTRLNEIKFMRNSITKYNSVLKACESGDGYEYKGLLQQLVEDLVNTTRPEMPDLQQRSEGLGNLLRTGLSMLSITGKKPTKHPLQNQLVIIFIIGGTNGEECKRLHRTVITSGVDNVVLFGSTRFLTPEETARQYIPL